MAKFRFRTNPLDFEVIHCGMRTITQEMTATMERTARSLEHFAGRDYSNGVFDKDGNVVCLYEGNPIHLWSVPFAVRAAIKFFGEDIYPGDLIFVNDPYTYNAGSHLPDAASLAPVFYEGELMFWTANRSHQVDMGGSAAGGINPMATDIYAEGLRVSPLKICENYKVRKDTFELLLKNWRYPWKQRGDLLSMIGSNRVGERRLITFCKRYGKETIKSFLEDLYDYTETLLRMEVEKLPDGTVYGEAKGEGGPRAPSYTIRTKITIKDSDVEVDLTESDSQVTSYVNSPFANTVCSVFIGLMTSIGKDMRYRAEGIARPIKILTKPGTIVHPLEPAPVSACTNFCAKEIIESIWSCLSQIAPETTPSGWGGIACGAYEGSDPRAGNRPYGVIDFLGCGAGCGGIWGTDGWTCGAPQICSGALHYPDVEVNEEVVPHRWERWEINPDSAGAGKWRGGFGTIEVLTNKGGKGYVHTLATGFRELPQPIIKGGKHPPRNQRWIIETDGSKTDANDQKSYEWKPGATLHLYLQGGCGIGNPFERDVNMVKEDVIEGKVSIGAAEREYGVVIDPNTLEVKEGNTTKLRSSHKK